MSKLTVLSVGGSIIAPEKVDIEFLTNFKKALSLYLDEDKERKIIIVCGGGAPARIYQTALRSVNPGSSSSSQDWLGIKATHLNGSLVNAIFSDYSKNELVTDPTSDFSFDGQVLVAAGWKPGFSTDTDAVYLARRFNGKLVINLSNIKKVYTADPKLDSNAKPIDKISWNEFRKIVGDEWVPGKNTPFDPIASKIAQEEGMKVICADGRDIENTIAILNGKEHYSGTTIF